MLVDFYITGLSNVVKFCTEVWSLLKTTSIWDEKDCMTYSENHQWKIYNSVQVGVVRDPHNVYFLDGYNFHFLFKFRCLTTYKFWAKLKFLRKFSILLKLLLKIIGAECQFPSKLSRRKFQFWLQIWCLIKPRWL